MEVFATMKLFTLLGGSAIIGANAFSMLVKKKKGDPMATADLKDSRELEGLIGNGMSISEDLSISQKFINEGICIFGPTGSGKTTGYFMPNLLNEGIEGSLIVLDPKGELYENTSYFQRTVCKRKVIRFAPLDPKLSYRYNLLENCKNTSEVLQLASTLLFNGALSIEIATGRKGGGTEWITMAEPLFAAALLYVKGLGNPLNTVEYALNLLVNFSTADLFYLFEMTDNTDAKMQFDIFKTTIGSENTVSGIKITLASNIKLFLDPNINEVGSYTDFRFEDLRKEKTIVYITYPEHKSLYISPFMASLFTQMLNTLIESYKMGALPIRILFDEFANIGMISNMQGYASTVRSREISLNVCLQSITQLEQIYGKESASAIINNLKTKIFLPGLSDMTTLNYASDLSGMKEIDLVSISEDKNDNRSYNYSKSTRNVLNPDEVRTLDTEELLIITSNRQPIISTQNTYYKNKLYTDRITKTPNIVIRNKYYDKEVKKEFKKLIQKHIELNKSLYNLENPKEETKDKKSLADEIFLD